MREIVIPILNDEYKVIVAFGNKDFVLKTLKKWGHHEKQVDFKIDRGMCFRTLDKHPVIGMPHKPKTTIEMATLAHESVHAIFDIFDFIGQDPHGEIFAHCVAAVMRGALK